MRWETVLTRRFRPVSLDPERTGNRCSVIDFLPLCKALAMSYPSERPDAAPRPAARRLAEHRGDGAASGAVARAQAAEESPREGQGKAKSVIFLWMAGGVTHIDSFDPKPDAPVEIRGTLDDIATSVPGMRFCETLPEPGEDRRQAGRAPQLFARQQRPPDQPGLYAVGPQGEHDAALSASRTSARWSGTCRGRATACRDTSPCRASRGPARRRTTCSSAAGWGASTAPYCLGGMPDEPDFTVGEKLDDPPAQAEEDLKPQVAGPAGRSAAGPPFRPPAVARRVRPGPAHARQERHGASRPNRNIKTPCGC